MSFHLLLCFLLYRRYQSEREIRRMRCLSEVGGTCQVTFLEHVWFLGMVRVCGCLRFTFAYRGRYLQHSLRSDYIQLCKLTHASLSQSQHNKAYRPTIAIISCIDFRLLSFPFVSFRWYNRHERQFAIAMLAWFVLTICTCSFYIPRRTILPCLHKT